MVSEQVSNELEPCPFCGSDRVSLMDAGPGNKWVRCAHCRAASDDGSRERVIAAWNTRAPSAREAKLVEALKGMERLIADNIHDNGTDTNRMFVDGAWHAGPVVDASFRIIKGLGQIARSVLATIPAADGEEG